MLSVLSNFEDREKKWTKHAKTLSSGKYNSGRGTSGIKPPKPTKIQWDIHFARHRECCIYKQKLKDRLSVFSTVYQNVIITSLWGERAQTLQMKGHACKTFLANNEVNQHVWWLEHGWVTANMRYHHQWSSLVECYTNSSTFHHYCNAIIIIITYNFKYLHLR